jgi:RND family efflux transporter MFP subunit
MMKRMIKPVSAVVVGLLVLSIASACAGEATVEIKQQIIEVKRGDLVVTVSADGKLTLPGQRELTFATGGTIAEILVEEGDTVTKGQVLARLDTVDLKRAVVAREQAVKSAELAVRNVEIDLKRVEDDIEASIENAEINLEKATDAYRRITYPYTYSTFTMDVPDAIASINRAMQRLDELQKVLRGEQSTGGTDDTESGTNGIVDTEAELRKVVEDLIKAKERLARGQGDDIFGDTAPGKSGILPFTSIWTLKAAEHNMEQARVALASARENAITGREKAMLALESANVNLDTVKNELDSARDELGKAEMKAPFDGIVARVPAKEGEVLTAVNYATRTIMAVINPGWMELEAEVDEIDIPGVKLGQEGIIGIDALPELELVGEVTFISHLSRQESGLVLYRINVGFIVPEDSLLREGMTATIDIVTNEGKDVLLVSDRAIKKDSEGNPVVKVMVNGQIEERPVTLGLSDGIETEIVQGLNEGDEVVIEIRIKSEASGLF